MYYSSILDMPESFPSPYLQIFSTELGITAIDFVATPTTIEKENEWCLLAKQQLSDYFYAGLTQFTLPLVIHATQFQQLVWDTLRLIPYGETISYKELAIRVNNPHAYRAVGSANGKNPLPIIIPCHRVINQNGQLGGYSAGISIKEALLQHECSAPIIN